MYHDCKRDGVLVVWFSLEVEDSRSFLLFFFFLAHATRLEGSNPNLLQWTCGVLTTGLPWKSLEVVDAFEGLTGMGL